MQPCCILKCDDNIFATALSLFIRIFRLILKNCVADPGSGIQYPGSGAFLTLDPGYGMGKESGSGSGMNNPDHISESLKTIFWVKKLNSLMWIRDQGWKKFGSGMGKVTAEKKSKGQTAYLGILLLLARSTQHAVNARHGRNGAGIGAVAHLLLQNRINRLPLLLQAILAPDSPKNRFIILLSFIHHAIETGTAELFPFREVLSQH